MLWKIVQQAFAVNNCLSVVSLKVLMPDEVEIPVTADELVLKSFLCFDDFDFFAIVLLNLRFSRVQ
jgi:hypothetical protein